MFRVFITSVAVLLCMGNATYGQGPPFGPRGQAMGAQAGRGVQNDDLQERLLEQRLEWLERQAEQFREATERLRERGGR